MNHSKLLMRALGLSDSVAEEVAHVDVNFLLLGLLLDLGGNGGGCRGGGGGGGGATGGHGGELASAFSDEGGDRLTANLFHHDFQVLFVGGNTNFLEELGDVVLS
jgi:hypothetical protein